jgi:hypothetical protein
MLSTASWNISEEPSLSLSESNGFVDFRPLNDDDAADIVKLMLFIIFTRVALQGPSNF